MHSASTQRAYLLKVQEYFILFTLNIAFWQTGFTGVDDPYESPVNSEVSFWSYLTFLLSLNEWQENCRYFIKKKIFQAERKINFNYSEQALAPESVSIALAQNVRKFSFSLMML